MTPQQLIDLCRATNQPLPSGRKIAAVVERLVEENLDLQHDLAFEAEGNRFAQAYIDDLKRQRDGLVVALEEALVYIPEFTVGHRIVTEALSTSKEAS